MTKTIQTLAETLDAESYTALLTWPQDAQDRFLRRCNEHQPTDQERFRSFELFLRTKEGFDSPDSPGFIPSEVL